MNQNNPLSTSTPFVLAGGGGHALSLLENLSDSASIAGYTALSESKNMPVEWLGDDSVAKSLAEKGIPFHIAFVYAGLPVMKKRKDMIDTYSAAGAKFVSIISPTAIITRHSTVGEGCAVLHRAVINRATLGNHVIVNTGAIVEHDCLIGSNTFIGPGAVIGGGVKIGDNCFIGLGARVMNGVTIASGVSVGIGVTVNRDLTEPGIYHGTPMRFHKTRNS